MYCSSHCVWKQVSVLFNQCSFVYNALFFSGCFLDFLFILDFQNFDCDIPRYGLLSISLYGLCWPSWIYKSRRFHWIGGYSTSISSNTFLYAILYLCSFWGSNYKHLTFLYCPIGSLKLCFSPQYFDLSSHWIKSIYSYPWHLGPMLLRYQNVWMFKFLT